ncbi:MAG: DUF58 domain-containing protein [Planctomycetota bacterium]|nr:DUF58 domain-containing protein [Planctomycetota bacterium]
MKLVDDQPRVVTFKRPHLRVYLRVHLRVLSRQAAVWGVQPLRSFMLVGTDPVRSKIRESFARSPVDALLDPRLAARLERLDVFSRKILSGKLLGERRSKRRGRSIEFDDFRDYTPGDDLRHIDWNAYARLDRLFIKLFREEEDLALHLVVDASPSMDTGNPNKLLFALRLATALGAIGLANQNRVSASVLGRRVAPKTLAAIDASPPAASSNQLPFASLRPLRGRTSLHALARFFAAALDPSASTNSEPLSLVPAPADLNTSLRSLASRGLGRGICVVMSDFLDEPGVDAGLRALAATDPGVMDIYCLHVLSPGEVNPELERDAGLQGDLRLTDAETGRAREVTVSPALIARYRRSVDRFCADLRARCLSLGLAPLRVTTDAPIERVVLDSLRRGGLLR